MADARRLIKDAVRAGIFATLATMGRYCPYRRDELRIIHREAIPYLGDVPAGSVGAERHRIRFLREFETPRPARSLARDLVYTERGMAWQAGRLVERYSLEAPSLTRDLLQRPRRPPAREYERATIVQAQYPYTYGDWVAEHFASLAAAGSIETPLLLPQHLLERSYVRRDLAILGLEATAVDAPVRIREATVLHKTILNGHWTAEAAETCRRAYRSDATAPRTGSMIYLSRRGVSSATRDRRYPHDVIEPVIRELGGRVVQAKSCTLDDYRALASEAETVVADHGAALTNMVFWQPKFIVELFSNEWWNAWFLFMAHSLNKPKYALVNIDEATAEGLRVKLPALLAEMKLATAAAAEPGTRSLNGLVEAIPRSQERLR